MQVYSCMTMFFHFRSPRVDTEYYLKGLTEKEVEEEGEEVTLRKHGEIGTSRYFSVRSRRLFFFILITVECISVVFCTPKSFWLCARKYKIQNKTEISPLPYHPCQAPLCNFKLFCK